MNAKFSPGRVVATPGALQALEASGQPPAYFLEKHVAGDWGELSDADGALNDRALIDGGRLLSAYRTLIGTKIWVVTEAVGDDGGRTSTCILLPDEY